MKKFLAFAGLVATASLVCAQVLYEQDTVVTHPGQGFGGADVSALENVTLGENIYGYGHQIAAGIRVADDFEATGAWEIGGFIFRAYQTNNNTVSPTLNDVNVRLWDDSPMNPTANVIFGDEFTNVLASSTWSNVYTTLETNVATTTNRCQWFDEVSVGPWNVNAGTYWIDWQTGGTLTSGPWAPPTRILGEFNTPGANALQSISGVWAPVEDSGSFTPDDFPFQVLGTGGGECKGDFDGDGDRDEADLAGLLAVFGCTSGCPSVGDFDDDGDIDEADLAGFLAVFGTNCP